MPVDQLFVTWSYVPGMTDRWLRWFTEGWVAGEVVEVRGGARSLHHLLTELEGRTIVVQW